MILRIADDGDAAAQFFDDGAFWHAARGIVAALRMDVGPPSYLSVLHIISGMKEQRRVSSEASFINGDLEP